MRPQLQTEKKPAQMQTYTRTHTHEHTHTHNLNRKKEVQIMAKCKSIRHAKDIQNDRKHILIAVSEMERHTESN